MLPYWIWDSEERKILGFTAFDWIRIAVIFFIGVLLGVKVRCDYVANSITNQCNKFILENYEGYESYTDAIGKFKSVHPDDAEYLDKYNMPLNPS